MLKKENDFFDFFHHFVLPTSFSSITVKKSIFFEVFQIVFFFRYNTCGVYVGALEGLWRFRTCIDSHYSNLKTLKKQLFSPLDQKSQKTSCWAGISNSLFRKKMSLKCHLKNFVFWKKVIEKM